MTELIPIRPQSTQAASQDSFSQQNTQTLISLPLRRTTRSIEKPPIQKAPKKKRNYIKIDLLTKRKLIQMVVNNGLTISQSARALKLKYATAKTILFQERHRKTRYQNQQPSNFRQIHPSEDLKGKFKISTLTNNKNSSTYDYFERLLTVKTAL